MGVSRTQVVKFIRKGDAGEKGEQGAVMRGPQAWSDCATGYAFQAGGVGEKWQDVVLYNGNYYSCKKSHTKTAGNYPGSTTDTNNGYWQLGDKIELVATKILLATYALVKNLGVEAIDMKDANGNVVFQAKGGNVVCNSGTFNNITVKGVTATGATINGIFLTKYPDGKAQLVINDGGLTYYADDADHTVIWSLGRSGNIVRNQTIDHWETVYLMKVPITSMEVYYDKKDGNSYYVVGKAFHKFVAGDNSTYTAYDGLVTESSVTDSTSPSSVTGITGNYVAGSSEGSAIMQTTSGKYTQERYIYTSGKADKETTTCTSDTPIDINTLTDIS